MSLRSLLAASAATATLVLAGCADDGPLVPNDPPPGGTVGDSQGGSEQGETPSAEPIQLSASTDCAVEGDLEGQFDNSQMLDYLTCIVPAVEEWIDTVYTGMPHPSAYFFVPEGVEGADASGCEYDNGSLQYCNGQQTVYFGQSATWEQYDAYGDAAAVVVLAHEVTHHFQNMLDMPQATEPNEQIRYENQADCGAGAFIAWAESQGWVDPNDDIADLAGSLEAAGAAEQGPNQDHGTIEERLGWFDAAYLSPLGQPLAECNALTPDAPII